MARYSLVVEIDSDLIWTGFPTSHERMMAR